MSHKRVAREKLALNILSVKTDCLSVLTAALQGSIAATAYNRPLAAIWKVIARTLDHDISSIVRSGKLVWVPAHFGFESRWGS